MTATQDIIQPDNHAKSTLFWGCFIVLVASAFGFVFRSFLMPTWAVMFDLSKTQQGEIFGVSFWPFALSIVAFSLIIDRIGYKKSMIFAFICHLISIVLTIFATGYWMLYAGTFFFALGNGAAEAVINPVVASLYPKEKTKWLNILHAGWPMGIAISGLLGIGLLALDINWRIVIGFILIPAVAYGALIINQKFPVNERVKAGVGYLDMLKEVGVLGALIIVVLCVFQLGSLFSWDYKFNIVLSIAIVAIFGYFVRSWGKSLFVLLLLAMVPLATMELGTDSWITDLMTPEMKKMGFQGGWVLVFTAVIMTVLRMYSGTVVKFLSPLALLSISALVSAVGLQLLSVSSGIYILLAAVLYAFGKTYLWGTMLGVVSEQFPKGGALALNITSAVGQLGVGIIGAVFLGFIQDSNIDKKLAEYDHIQQTHYHEKLVTGTRSSIFGDYKTIDYSHLSTLDEASQQVVEQMENKAKKAALSTVSLLPSGLFVFFILLIIYFNKKGGYKPIDII